MIPVHIKPGDAIPPTDAAFWNSVLEVVSAYRAGKRRLKPPPMPRIESYVWVRNDTDRDYEFGDVIAFDEPAFDVNEEEETEGDDPAPSKISLDYFRHPVFKSRDAERPKDLGRFGLALDALPKNAAGRVLTVGTMFVRVDVKKDWHLFADIQSQKDAEGETPETSCRKLRSGVYGGTQILWKPDDAEGEEKWCVVRIGGFWNDWCHFRLVDKLVGEHHAKAHALWYDRDAEEWREDDQDEIVKGWKWDKVWDPDKEADCHLINGRWFWEIPEDCGRNVAGSDEEDAETQEDGYRAEGLLPSLEGE